MKRVFRSIVFAAASLAEFSAFCEVDAYSAKYNVKVIDKIYPASEVIIPLIDKGTVTYDNVSEYAFSTKHYSLGSLIYDSEISTINASLLLQLNDKSLNSFVMAQRIIIVNSAINDNYSALMQMYDSFLKDYMDAGFISKDEFQRLKTAYETTRAANIGDIKRISGATDDISQKMAGITASLNDVVSRLNELKNTPQEGMTEAQRKALFDEIKRLTEERIARALEAEAVKRASSVQEKVVFIGGGGSIADFNFTNAVVSISKYLGAGNEVNTNGVTFVPPSINGNPAQDVIAYLDNKGVVGFHDSSSEETNNPFTASFTLERNDGATTLTAPFIAPSNWADGTTILCDNGVYKARPKTAWSYYDGKFHNARVIIGSQIVTPQNLTASVVGDWYCHVTYSSSGEYSVSISQQTTGGDWYWLVGTLAQDGETGELYSTYELGATPVILCYE